MAFVDRTENNTHPAVMNVYFMLGFFSISWFGSLESTYVFSTWGLLAGGLLWAAAALTLSIAFPVLGIAVATAVSASVSIVTSLLWTVCVFHDSTRSMFLATLGIGIVIVGLIFVVFSASLGRLVDEEKKAKTRESDVPPPDNNQEETSNLLPSASSGHVAGSPAFLAKLHDSGHKMIYFSLGVVGAVLSGAIGGSALVPSLFAGDGTVFVASSTLKSFL